METAEGGFCVSIQARLRQPPSLWPQATEVDEGSFFGSSRQTLQTEGMSWKFLRFSAAFGCALENP